MRLPRSFRLRPDLIIQPQDTASGTWVVKDPVSLRFFLFGGDEHFILERLNGDATIQQIIDEFARERAPKRLTPDGLHRFIASLYRNGLASSESPGQGRLLLQREDEQRLRQSILGWSNVLAIRLPGFNPEALLEGMYALLRWCFSGWWLIACLGVFVCSASIALAEWKALSAQWAHWEEFVLGPNLVWLGLALVATKCLHELAHGLVCKHFGGRCHEMGIILLIFTPCLYCNVTDAWMLRSRWQRVAISAAGMAMEVFLASLAMIVWRYSEPGVVNSVSFNVILVCGVSTLLFNGNPLLKYDGYYILSDVLGLPNLWQESRNQLYSLLRKSIDNGDATDAHPPSRRAFLLAYAISSIAYRICLTIGILLFLYRILHPQGLDVLLLVVAVSIVVQSTIVWAGPLTRWVRNPSKFRQTRKEPIAILAIVAATSVGVVTLVPLPCRVAAPAVLQPADAKRVYITTPGVLAMSVKANDVIRKHATLALLENPDLASQRLAIAGDVSRAEARVKTLELRLNSESDVAAQLMVAHEILADLREQERLRDEEIKALTVASPADGTVIVPPARPLPVDDARDLPAWVGTPLDPENRGCYLERGTLVCLIGDPKHHEAVVLVDETDVPSVRVGQTVRMRLEHATHQILTGSVVEIAEINADSAPAELIAQHDVAVRTAGPAASKPIRTLYQVRVALDPGDTPLLVGARGMVRIEVSPQTLFQRVTRWIRRTLTIEPKN